MILPFWWATLLLWLVPASLLEKEKLDDLEEWVDPIQRTADHPMTMDGGQVFLVDEIDQLPSICGSVSSRFFGIKGPSAGYAYNDYLSVCSQFGFAVANVSYPDLTSSLSALLDSCDQVSNGMWVNAIEGYTDDNCLMFVNR